MSVDTKRLREMAERYARHAARENLDAQEWGEEMLPWDVIALLDEIDRLQALADMERDLNHRLPNQLAAVTAARDEACDIAWRFTQPAQIGISDSREVGQQIATLRNVGKESK